MEVLGVLTAFDLAALVVVVGFLVWLVQFKGRKVVASVGAAKVAIEGPVLAQLEQINAAVNHRAPDDDTLYQHAKATRELVAVLAARVDDIADYQRDRNHGLANAIQRVEGQVAGVKDEMRGYVVADAEAHEEMRVRLQALEQALKPDA